jgi:hypothetical protein
MSGFISWLFTPVRIFVLGVAVLTIAVVVGVAVQGGPSERGAIPAPSRPTPTTVNLLDADQAKTAAVDFVTSWCDLDGRTPEQWSADLKARSTPDLAHQWEPNASQALRHSCPYAGVDIRSLSGPSARVAVRVAGGRRLAVDVLLVDGRALVSGIEEEQYPGDGMTGIGD